MELALLIIVVLIIVIAVMHAANKRDNSPSPNWREERDKNLELQRRVREWEESRDPDAVLRKMNQKNKGRNP